METRVRFAPSPTGPLHLGNTRTALFNWLFAQHESGKFLLRIEDTDKVRSEKKYEEDIFEGLKWLGLEWEEGIYRQSERLDLYEKYLKILLDKNLAYYCFCSIEELEMDRQSQLSQGFAPKYSGRCRSLTEEEIKKKSTSQPSVIRFKVPEKKLAFTDLIRGRIEFDTGLIGDIVVAKSPREPLYNFTAAIDDSEMRITHVIRGEDHLSNTPKQILVQEALGFNHPNYAHLPLILGPDRKKLSKRLLENSLNDYRKNGYLPEAMLNFLVLLGWHPKEDREVISREEMTKEFELKRIQKGGAIFNVEKLDWLNTAYIKTLALDNLFSHMEQFIPAAWRDNPVMVKKIIEVERNRMKHLPEFSELASFFFVLPDYPPDMLIWKNADHSIISRNLKSSVAVLGEIAPDNFRTEVIQDKIAWLVAGENRGEVLWPFRVALSGQEASPGPTEIAGVLGKQETLARLEKAIAKLEKIQE